MRAPGILPMWCLLSWTLAAQSYPPPFPRKNAEKLLDTDQVIVWRVVWPKSEATELHRHPHDQTGTYYAPGGRIITNPDGSKREVTTAVGDLSNTKRGTTHIEEGSTDSPLRAVFLELLGDGPSGPLDTSSSVAPAFPREGAEKRSDDERVTTWDYTWPAGTSTGPIRYPRNTVTVWLGSGSVRVTAIDGKATALRVEPGDMRYSKAGTVERMEILSGTPRAIIFELK
jgi:hypothetical protein